MPKFIDISTEEKKKEVYKIFESFNRKSDIFHYFNEKVSSTNYTYIDKIAKEIGFDFNSYKHEKNIKICPCCGKEFKSKYKEQKFCCLSCASTYNNLMRTQTEETRKKISESLKEYFSKQSSENKEIKNHKISKILQKIKEDKIYEKTCEYCGKVFTTKFKNARFCTKQCFCEMQHKKCYDDFLNNQEKYCDASYTPKSFKKDFLEEQNGVCAICGCKPEHNGKPLVFVLDHIDGDASNNHRENLRLICPNCDSQLDTFKSKNKHSARRNYFREKMLRQLKT